MARGAPGPAARLAPPPGPARVTEREEENLVDVEEADRLETPVLRDAATQGLGVPLSGRVTPNEEVVTEE